MSMLFISYSTRDENVARMVQDFLMNTFRLTHEDVFLSSEAITAGDRVENTILEALSKARYLVFILSENFFQSPYCMCELGATWALKKDPFILLMNPLTVDSEKIIKLPASFRNFQSVSVRGGDVHRVNRYFEKMIEKISVYKPLEGNGGYAVYGDYLVQLSSFLAESPHASRAIDLRGAFVFHNPAETSSTLRVLANNRDSVSLLVDFSVVKPSFSGCAIPLNNQSWQHECSAGYCLSFEIQASEPLRELKLEIKGKDKSLIKAQQLNVGKHTERMTFKLSEINEPELFSDMEELVFLFQPDSFDAISRVEIGNITLSYDA